jgi:hypothetical protein
VNLLVAALLFSSPPADPMAEAGLTNARVLLSGHRGGLDLEADPPVLKLSVLARNTLAVPVDRVTVGLLFAAEQSALAAYDPAVLYRSPPAPPTDVGAFRRSVETLIEPGADVPLTVEMQLGEGYPSPQVFQTHILSYRLAAVKPDLLFELVNTDVPADELAVVETLALAGDASAKRAARERWGSDASLVAGLVLRLRQPVEGTADLETTMAWICAVRALGVVGGPLAAATLQPLLDDSRLPAFDDELQVVRAARAQHSRLEVPLAYAMPPEARRMQDVIAAALSDASSLDIIPEQATDSGGSEPVVVKPGGRTEAPAVPPWLLGAATGLLVGVAVFVGLRLATRRRSK